MFTNAVLSPQPAQAESAVQGEKGGEEDAAMRPLQKTPAPLIGPGKEGAARKPLFGKNGRRESGTARLVEEISKMNGLLEMIAKNQAAMQVGAGEGVDGRKRWRDWRGRWISACKCWI